MPEGAGAMPTSNIRYTIGLLGSCFTDAKGDSHCMTPSLQPRFNTSWLATSPGVGTDTDGMLSSLHVEPVLVLLAWLVLVGTSAVHARRLHRQATQCKEPASGTVHRCLVIATYVQEAAALLLFLVMVLLRVQVAHANSAFNAANGQRALGPAALTFAAPYASMLVLSASTGTGFSCVCIAAILLFGVARWERRQLAREAPQRRTDVESRPSRWAALAQRPLARPGSPTHSITISTPTPVYTPDHLPTQHEAWMEVPARKVRPYPAVP